MRQEMTGFWDGSGISWTICKQSAPRSRQTTTPTPHQSIFTGRMLFLTPKQQCQTTTATGNKHRLKADDHTHTHTRLTALSPGLPGWAGTREVKPIWILLKILKLRPKVLYKCDYYYYYWDSGISWAICKSASLSREITTPAPHHSVFYRPDALPAAQPTASKQWKWWQASRKTVLARHQRMHKWMHAETDRHVKNNAPNRP